MDERRRSRIRWVVAGGLTWLGLFGLAFGLWYADEVGAFRNCYLKIRTPSGQTAWVQFKGNRLRTASSSDALWQSAWVPAEAADWEHTGFPAIALSSSDEEPGNDLRAQFDLYGTQCEVKWQVTKQDLDGTRWTYAMKDAVETATARHLDDCPEISAPNPQQLALGIETQAEREGEDLKLGVGLHVTGAHQRELEVTDIRKEGKSVLARIEVKNEAKRIVLTREQPLSELGFT